MSVSKKILFQMSASISAYKACHVISRLVQDGHDVQVVATPNVFQFVGPATLEGLTRRPALTKVFEPGHMMDHIHLARWCDLAILCPASASQLNKISAGIADDLIGTLFLAYELKKKPYLIAPAMNVEMYTHPTTQSSLEKLSAMGAKILESPEGIMACGEYGQGRLMEPDALLAAIRHAIAPLKKEAKRILVTAGGTKESIDGVRHITNMSTGKTGELLAETFQKEGHDLTLLRSFSDFKDLNSKLETELAQKSYDWMIHMAAVSDYSVESVKAGAEDIATDEKIDSNKDLTISLKRNFKIVSKLTEYSINKDLKIVAFKLTDTKDDNKRREAVRRLFDNPGVHYVVHNDLTEISSENDGRQHQFTIYDRELQTMSCNGKAEMIEKLGGLL